MYGYLVIASQAVRSRVVESISVAYWRVAGHNNPLLIMFGCLLKRTIANTSVFINFFCANDCCY